MSSTSHRLAGLLIMAGLASILVTLGCGPSETRYIPAADSARASLEAALTAWKNGAPHEPVKSRETSITMFDSRWQSKAKLESFEITEELPPNPHRAFRVKMRLARQKADEETTYLVIGIDPLLVYRSEDYERERSVF
jgi:hypothetical protein